MRAFAALAGSYNSTTVEMSKKWIKIDNNIENFIKTFEDNGLHE